MISRLRAGALALMALTPATLAPRCALAAEPAFDLRIIRQPLEQALVDLAVQSGTSIASRGGGACGLKPVSLKGRFTVRAALDSLLGDSDCAYRFIDTTSVVVFARTRNAADPPRSAPTASAPPDIDPVITVVAARRPAPLSRSPYSLTSVGADRLAALATEDVEGLAPLVAGMTVTNLGAGRDKIFLRGLSDGVLTGKTQSTVGLYIDDVLISYDAPDPDLRLTDIASVDVLRGPQGAIYGSGSIAGVVQIRTRQPDLEAYAAEASVEAGSTQGGAPSGGVEAMINIPIAPDRLGLRLVGYRMVDGGYIDDVVQRRENVNRTDRTGLRASATVALDDGWLVRLGGLYQSLNSADSQYDTGGLPKYERSVNTAEPHDNDFSELHLQVEKRLDGLTVKSTTALIHHQLDTRYDATDALPLLAPGANGVATFDDATRKRLLSEDLTVASTGAGALQWLAGAYYLRDNETDHSLLDAASAPATALYREDRGDLQESYALYGEATLHLAGGFYLTAGVRLFRTDSQVQSAIAAVDGQRTVDVGEHESGVAPKVVLRYDLSPSALVYIQATEGYRGGGVNTSGLAAQPFAATPTGPNPPLFYRGDELWNYEIGARASAWNGAVEVHGALFYDDWRRLQSDQLLPSGLSFTTNLGFAINKGLELEVATRPAPGLDLRVNLTVNDPQLTGQAAANAAPNDALLPAISRLSGGAALTYVHALPFGLIGELGAEANYVGRSRVSFDPAAGNAMGGYGDSRLTLGVRSPHWSVQLIVDNLFDRAADTFAYGNPFSRSLTAQSTPLRPRTAMLKLSAAF